MGVRQTSVGGLKVQDPSSAAAVWKLMTFRNRCFAVGFLLLWGAGCAQVSGSSETQPAHAPRAPSPKHRALEDAGSPRATSSTESIVRQDAGALVCPKGTQVHGASTSHGEERFCRLPDGQRHGPYQKWNVAGSLVSVGSYRHGKKHGQWAEGLSRGSYVDGKKHGPWHEVETYFEEVTTHTGSYKHGKRDGRWVSQYTQWRVEAEYRYGEEISSREIRSRRGAERTTPGEPSVD